MDHRAETARTLRVTHGLGYKRIAKVLGATRDQVRRWLGQKRGSQSRGERIPSEFPTECATCGLPSRGPECPACCAIGRFNRRQEIESAFNEMLPLAEMAARFGKNPNSMGAELHRMRHDGWDLPYRPTYPR